MAAGVGVARRLGCAGSGCLFFIVCASVLARVASVPGERCKETCAARAPAHARALSHFRNPRLRGGRAKPGGAAVDSDLRRGGVIWWALRSGMDVEPALWPAYPQQRIADARDRTQRRMGGGRCCSSDRVHRRTGTRREVSFGLSAQTMYGFYRSIDETAL